MSNAEKQQVAATTRQIMARAELHRRSRRLLGEAGPALADRHVRAAGRSLAVAR